MFKVHTFSVGPRGASAVLEGKGPCLQPVINRAISLMTQWLGAPSMRENHQEALLRCPGLGLGLLPSSFLGRYQFLRAAVTNTTKPVA